jgi:hypothetical protein
MRLEYIYDMGLTYCEETAYERTLLLLLSCSTSSSTDKGWLLRYAGSDRCP